MKMSAADNIRFIVEKNTLVDKIQDMLWDSDIFREISMNQVEMPADFDETGSANDDYINACSEKQAEMITAVLITLMQKNHNLL